MVNFLNLIGFFLFDRLFKCQKNGKEFKMCLGNVSHGMLEMGRSNALIRIRWGTRCTHLKIERTHSLFLKTETDKRGIEFGNA